MTGPARAAVGVAVIFCVVAGSAGPGAAWVNDTAPPTPTLPASTERVSISSAEVQAQDASQDALVSAAGRFAVFVSSASNLVPGDTNDTEDVFLRDRVVGRTTRVSVDRDGQQRTDSSYAPTMSSDARFIAFSSQVASRRIAFYVYDRQSRETKRVFSDVGLADGSSYPGLTGISEDGRFLVFHTPNQLAPRDHGREVDSVYLFDRRRHRFSLVSVTDRERDAGDSCCGAISASGRYVAFPADRGVFVRDRAAHTTERVSMSLNGENQPASAGWADISAGGRYVSFASDATNLVPHDTNGTGDIFIRDRLEGVTSRVSISTSGEQADEYSYDSSVSSNGRYVAFLSSASTLVEGDGNRSADLFIRDRRLHTTRCISVDRRGRAAGVSGYGYSLSPSGHWAGFASASPRLVAGDTNGVMDAFVSRLR